MILMNLDANKEMAQNRRLIELHFVVGKSIIKNLAQIRLRIPYLGNWQSQPEKREKCGQNCFHMNEKMFLRLEVCRNLNAMDTRS